MSYSLIVVIDDDESIYEIIETTLATMNIETVFFNVADDALPFIAQHQPQLVLMDLHLPYGMKGWEAIGVIKSDSAMQSVPVVAFTAATGHHIREAMQNGADNFLNKPFSLSQLKHLVNRYTGVIPN